MHPSTTTFFVRTYVQAQTTRRRRRHHQLPAEQKGVQCLPAILVLVLVRGYSQKLLLLSNFLPASQPASQHTKQNECISVCALWDLAAKCNLFGCSYKQRDMEIVSLSFIINLVKSSVTNPFIQLQYLWHNFPANNIAFYWLCCCCWLAMHHGQLSLQERTSAVKEGDDIIASVPQWWYPGLLFNSML